MPLFAQAFEGFARLSFLLPNLHPIPATQNPHFSYDFNLFFIAEFLFFAMLSMLLTLLPFISITGL